MAKNEKKVMDFVEQELNANPGVSTTELFERTKKMDTGVAKLSLRQFNARYPLQIKRKQSLAAGGGSRRKSPRRGSSRRAQQQEEQRLAVRKVFLGFATDLSAAESRKELVEVLARVDDYVGKAMKAADR